MAKIIFTSRYIRNASKAGNLVKYMGTREGVEKLPYGIDHSPATKKQQDLIASIVKKFPTATDYPEYVEYQQRKEKASATEFIDAFVERNSDRIGNLKKLVSYIAERPSVEKLGRHGLFSQTDDKIDLDTVAEEVASHQGILWTHVISLRREDAERLGYNNAEHGRKPSDGTLFRLPKPTKSRCLTSNGTQLSIILPTIRMFICWCTHAIQEPVTSPTRALNPCGVPSPVTCSAMNNTNYSKWKRSSATC